MERPLNQTVILMIFMLGACSLQNTPKPLDTASDDAKDSALLSADEDWSDVADSDTEEADDIESNDIDEEDNEEDNAEDLNDEEKIASNDGRFLAVYEDLNLEARKKLLKKVGIIVNSLKGLSKDEARRKLQQMGVPPPPSKELVKRLIEDLKEEISNAPDTSADDEMSLPKPSIEARNVNDEKFLDVYENLDLEGRKKLLKKVGEIVNSLKGLSQDEARRRLQQMRVPPPPSKELVKQLIEELKREIDPA